MYHEFFKATPLESTIVVIILCLGLWINHEEKQAQLACVLINLRLQGKSKLTFYLLPSGGPPTEVEPHLYWWVSIWPMLRTRCRQSTMQTQHDIFTHKSCMWRRSTNMSQLCKYQCWSKVNRRLFSFTLTQVSNCSYTLVVKHVITSSCMKAMTFVTQRSKVKVVKVNKVKGQSEQFGMTSDSYSHKKGVRGQWMTRILHLSQFSRHLCWSIPL